MPGPTELRRISARLGAIAESATLAVDAKAKAMKAQGHNVIGFGAGEPDFPTPAHIVEAAIKACADVKYHRYTPAAGLPELREAIAAKTLRDSGFSCTADQVLVTNTWSAVQLKPLSRKVLAAMASRSSGKPAAGV